MNHHNCRFIACFILVVLISSMTVPGVYLSARGATRFQLSTQSRFGAMTGAAWSTDGTVLAVSSDRGVWLFNPDNWDAPPRRLPSEDDMLTDVAFLPDSHEIVTISEKGTVRQWDLASQTSRVLFVFGTNEEPHAFALSPDGVYIAVAVGRNIRLWNRVEAREVALVRRHNGDIEALAFSPDSTLLASASSDYYEPIYVSYTRNGDMHLALLIPPENRYDFDRRVSSLTFSRDGQHLLSGHHDRTVRVWYLDEHERVRTLTGWHDWVVAVAIRPWCDVAQGCDDVLVGGDWQGWLVRVRWSMGGIFVVNRLQWNGWKALAASPRSNLLAAIGYDGQLWILDIKTLDPVAVLGEPPDGA